MELCGFLAPDGTFTECEYWSHTATAESIANGKYNQTFYSGIQAEDFLYEKGYVGFYARSASHRFVVGEGKEKRIVLLTDEQKDFIINNLANANNNDQRVEIENILAYDSDYREDSILSRMEDKYITP